MKRPTITTIAAVLLGAPDTPSLGEMADAILATPLAERSGIKAVTWDCDDLVFLDFDAVRIALHEIPATETDPGFVCIGAGASPDKLVSANIDYAKLAHRLVDQFSPVLHASSVYWHEHVGPLRAEVMDDFHDELDRMLDYLSIQMQEAAFAKASAKANAAPAYADEIAERAHKPRYEDAAPQDDCIDMVAASTASRKEILQDEDALDTLREFAQPAPAKGIDASAVATTSPAIHATIYLTACLLFFLVPAIGTALYSYAALRDLLDSSLMTV